MNGGVKVVEKVAVVFKNLVFIVVLRQLVVNIVKLYLLGEKPVAYDADAVPAHLLVGDGLLGGFGDTPVPSGLFHRSGQPALLRAGELLIRVQPDKPPQVGLILF